MDRDLVERAKSGDREAFAILARSRSDRLFGIAHRIRRDNGRSEDAVQLLGLGKGSRVAHRDRGLDEPGLVACNAATEKAPLDEQSPRTVVGNPGWISHNGNESEASVFDDDSLFVLMVWLPAR